MLFTREQALQTGRVPIIAGHTRTRVQLQSELSAMPGNFIKTNLPDSILHRESEELLQFRSDVPTFLLRKVPVTDGHFQMVADLKALLPAEIAEGDTAGTVYGGFDDIEDAQGLEIRARAALLRKLCLFSGMSPELCGLGDAKGNLRLMDAANAIVARCRPHMALFAVPEEAETLLTEMEQLVLSMVQLRKQQAGEAGTIVVSTDRQHRIRRLLLDVMRYVCAAGSYVFDGDPTRESAYTLQHVNQFRNKGRKGAPKSDGNVGPVTGRLPVDDDN